MRNLILLGVAAGISASVPIFYQANPEAFHRFVKGVVSTPEQDVAKPAKAATPQVLVAEAPLAGRKAKLPVDDQGHFSAEFRMNGRPLDAMIDTGATLVAINVSTARRIGLNLTASDFKYSVNTANGSTQAAAATIDSLQLGRIEIKDVRAVVLEDKALKGTLIGQSFLNRLTKYRVENGAMVLEQ